MTRILTVATQLLVAIGLAAGQPPQPGPNSDAKVAALLAAWEKTRNELPVLRYTYTQTQRWPAEFSDSPNGTTSVEDRELTVDWKTGRYRLIRTESGEKNGEFKRTTAVFDGRTIRSLTETLTRDHLVKPGAEVEAGILEGHLPSIGANEASFQLPYVSVGHLPNLASGTLTEQLTPASPRDMLYYARRERVAGVTCDVYASFPHGSKSVELASEVFVDPVHYNCVQKYATYNGKLPYQIYTYKWGDQGDWWLPSECEVEAYSGGGRLVSRLKAVPVRVQPVAGDAEFFDLRFTDGMKVTRRIVPKTKGARARVTQESAVVRDGEVVSDAGGVGFGWRSPWLWAGGVVLALAVCVLLFRRRRRKLSEGSS